MDRLIRGGDDGDHLVIVLGLLCEEESNEREELESVVVEDAVDALHVGDGGAVKSSADGILLLSSSGGESSACHIIIDLFLLQIVRLFHCIEECDVNNCEDPTFRSLRGEQTGKTTTQLHTDTREDKREMAQGASRGKEEEPPHSSSEAHLFPYFL